MRREVGVWKKGDNSPNWKFGENLNGDVIKGFIPIEFEVQVPRRGTAGDDRNVAGDEIKGELSGALSKSKLFDWAICLASNEMFLGVSGVLEDRNWSKLVKCLSFVIGIVGIGDDDLSFSNFRFLWLKSVTGGDGVLILFLLQMAKSPWPSFFEEIQGDVGTDRKVLNLLGLCFNNGGREMFDKDDSVWQLNFVTFEVTDSEAKSNLDLLFDFFVSIGLINLGKDSGGGSWGGKLAFFDPMGLQSFSCDAYGLGPTRRWGTFLDNALGSSFPLWIVCFGLV